MKRVLLPLLLLLLPLGIFPQDFDQMMVSMYQPSLEEIEKNSASLFVKFMEEHKTDSASMIIDYWEKKCGISEPNFRARVLLSLTLNNFDEQIFATKGIQNMKMYRLRYERTNAEDINYYNYFGSTSTNAIPLGGEFDQLTLKHSNLLMNNYPEESIEYLVCKYYAGDFNLVYSKFLDENVLPKSIIGQNIKKELAQLHNTTELNYALIVGAWIPNGQIDMLGVHPELGFQAGWKRTRMNYDFTLLIRFLSSASRYSYTDHDNKKKRTNDYLGVYFGFDTGYDFYVKKRSEFSVLGGLGLDVLDIVPENKKKDIESISALSANFNLGLGYRYYISTSHYLGLKVKYNFIDYSRSKHFDYGGNAITLQITWGGLFNWNKSEGMKYYNRNFRE